MDSDRVVIRRTEAKTGFFTVEADNKISTYLCWGEMLEQLIALTHPDIKHHRYHARTVDEEYAEEKRRLVAKSERCELDPICLLPNGHSENCDSPF